MSFGDLSHDNFPPGKAGDISTAALNGPTVHARPTVPEMQIGGAKGGGGRAGRDDSAQIDREQFDEEIRESADLARRQYGRESRRR